MRTFFPLGRRIPSHDEDVHGQASTNQMFSLLSNSCLHSIGAASPCIRSACWWPRGRWERSLTSAYGTRTRCRPCPFSRTCTRTASPAWPLTSRDRYNTQNASVHTWFALHLTHFSLLFYPWVLLLSSSWFSTATLKPRHSYLLIIGAENVTRKSSITPNVTPKLQGGFCRSQLPVSALWVTHLWLL